MARQIYKMCVTELVDHTPTIREVFLKCAGPEEFVFKAGQFVMLHVPAADGAADGKPVLRAYSIASTSENRSGYRLIFKFVDGGVASRFVWSLKGGETLNFTGPFGRVFFKEPPTEQIVFINTGSGVSQHFSFIESNLHRFPNLKYRLLFGVRHLEDIYYRQDLERLKSQLSDFRYEFVLSRPPESWAGLRGYVQNHLHTIADPSLPTTYYLCGNGGMIKDTKSILAERGVDPGLIWAEAFD